jgi:hypothetical protein
LWVTYKFLLLKPQLSRSLASSAGWYHAYGGSTGVTTGTTIGGFGYGAGAASYGAPTLGANSGLTVSYPNNSSNMNVASLQPGNYLMVWNAVMVTAGSASYFGDTANSQSLYAGAPQTVSIGGFGINGLQILQNGSTPYVPSTHFEKTNGSLTSYTSTASITYVFTVPVDVSSGASVQVTYDITTAGADVAWDVFLVAIPAAITLQETITERQVLDFLKEKYSTELAAKFKSLDTGFNVHAMEAGNRLKFHERDTYSPVVVRDDGHVKDTYLEYKQIREKIDALKLEADAIKSNMKAPGRAKRSKIMVANTPNSSGETSRRDDDDSKSDSGSDSEDYFGVNMKKVWGDVEVKFPKSQELKTLAWMNRDKRSPECVSLSDAVKLGYLVQTGPKTYESTPVDTDFVYTAADKAKLSGSLFVGGGVQDLTQSTTDLIKDVTSAVLAAKSNSHKK